MRHAVSLPVIDARREAMTGDQALARSHSNIGSIQPGAEEPPRQGALPIPWLAPGYMRTVNGLPSAAMCQLLSAFSPVAVSLEEETGLAHRARW